MSLAADHLADQFPRNREIWRPVVGHKGKYEVSSLGRVRSLPRIFERGPGTRTRGTMVRWKGKMLNPTPMECSGHLVVGIGLRGRLRLVHHLVLEAFVGPRPLGMECLHRNDIPDDNWIGNLRWGTRAENIEDAFRNGGRIRSTNPDPRVGQKRLRKNPPKKRYVPRSQRI